MDVAGFVADRTVEVTAFPYSIDRLPVGTAFDVEVAKYEGDDALVHVALCSGDERPDRSDPTRSEVGTIGASAPIRLTAHPVRRGRVAVRIPDGCDMLASDITLDGVTNGDMVFWLEEMEDGSYSGDAPPGNYVCSLLWVDGSGTLFRSLRLVPLRVGSNGRPRDGGAAGDLAVLLEPRWIEGGPLSADEMSARLEGQGWSASLVPLDRVEGERLDLRRFLGGSDSFDAPVRLGGVTAGRYLVDARANFWSDSDADGPQLVPSPAPRRR
ncbi:MAG: hypothetical protein R3F34_18735 [Planctomycetota bacterium]